MSRQHAFVVMSFKDDQRMVFEKGIRPAIESLGMDARRVDYDHFTGQVSARIVDLLHGAYFVIGEMSQQRPNCYYEIGYAHALGRPVILLIDDPSKIHFDIQDFPFIVYSSLNDLQQKLH